MNSGIDYYVLGMRIRAAREKNHLTQERLGEMCSLSTAHIGHIERGTRTPSLDSVYAIATALNISIDSLLLDSFSDINYFVHLSAALSGKDEEKVRRFVSIVNTLADKIDDI